MPRNPHLARRGAIRMGLLLGLAIASLLAAIVGVIGYTTNQQVTGIFDRSSRDSRELAVTNVSRFAQLLASNTAVTVRPSVLDHNYTYIREVLGDMTSKEENLLYVGVLDDQGEVIEESGVRDAESATATIATAPIRSQQREVGSVELHYSMLEVNARIRAADDKTRAERRATFNRMLIAAGLVLGIGILVAAAFGMWLSRPVTRMADAAGQLGEGNFDVRVDVSGPSEIRQLASTFNSMAGELKASVAASIEQAALEREVATARRLQQEMMPAEGRLTVGELEVVSWYRPAGNMAGDWWTISEATAERPTTLLVGDVIGHGIPAALFTAAAKSAYRAAAMPGLAPELEQLLSTIDESLRGFEQKSTMSCCAVQFHPGDDQLVVSVAAHPPALRFHDGEMELLDGDGPLLGDPNPGDASFGSSRHDFLAGDLLALCTDGLLEATDARGRMFGLRRLGSTLQAHIGDDLEAILQALERTFFDYVGGDHELQDDVTVVLVRRRPTESRAQS